jgi:hypothetical protein
MPPEGNPSVAVDAPFDPEKFLEQYELQDTAVIPLKNERNDDDLLGRDRKPVFATVYSPGSPQGQKALNKSARRSQLRLMKSLRGESDAQDADSAQKEHAEKLAEFTVTFSDNFPVSPLSVYKNPRLLYIHRQIEQAIDKLGNFSKGSSPS